MVRERQLCAVVAIGIVVIFCPLAWGQFGGGAGTASDPYLIYTAEQFKAMRTNPGDLAHYVHYKLMADIDFDKVLMSPIGASNARFVGVVDGNGRTVSSVKIMSSWGDNVGLFGYASAEFRDLRLVDVEIDAPQSKAVGGLAGYASGSIHQCVTSCSVSGQGLVGGVLGWNDGSGRVSQCCSTAKVSGDTTVGGLIGRSFGFVRDSYATGAVQGRTGVGGLTGSGALICNCYAAGPVQATWFVGGLTGGGSACRSSFWDTQVSGPTTRYYGVGRTTEELRAAATFKGWGRGAAWTIDEGRDYPRLAWEKRPGAPLETRAFPEWMGQGTAEQPYRICTAEEFNAIGDFADEWDRHYRLECDIDMADLDEPFRVIGYDPAPFTGVFDGNGHAISNFNYPLLGSYLALFGCTRQATIKRLTLIDPHLEQGSSSRGGVVGPLIGQQVEGTVEACGVDGGVVSAGRKLGGLVGVCYGGTIRQCYSTCKVLSWTDAMELGGLLGSGARCNIDNCYAQGQVSGTTSIGGLIGRMEQGTVSHCYATGVVRRADTSGGLIGMATETFTAGCFWDIETTRQATSMAGIGAATAEMQQAETFISTGWDFVGEDKNGTADIWSIDEGRDYPRFTPEPVEPPVRLWADDFEDGEPLPLWQVHEPTPDAARLREVNGRLELHVPTAPGQWASAARLSSGWALDSSQDFNVKVEYHFTGSDEGEAWVSLGVTPEAATPAGRRIEWTAGCLEDEPVYRGNRADGVGFATWWNARGSDNGTLYLSYDAARDELYLSFVGYGPANALHTVPGLLKGYWAGAPMYVVLRGGARGMAVSGQEAWLDNFAVDAGSVIP